VCPQLRALQRYDRIVGGARNQLDFAFACDAERFLLNSSGGVYGREPADLDRLPQDYLGSLHPMNGANAYSVAKRAAEHLCALYA
jgi:dTDP-glucose 4,6-dehydratase